MLKNIARKLLKKFNIGVIPYHSYQIFEALDGDIQNLLDLPEDKLRQLVPLLKKSKSQIKQDLFALLESDFKKEGFFVEFGATNGITLSNTHLLEKEFNWNGILAEPARKWHEDLKKNRNCHIETDCVWRESVSSLEFIESSIGELSTLSNFKSSGEHEKARRDSVKYQVNTISLNDLLDKYKAPEVMDYLSIDTEGSEFEILSQFDFQRYKFRVICCEHAYTPTREKIYKLLSEHGYQRKYLGFSKWDDWYVLAN